LHTPKLEKKPAKDVSLKPIEILSILEGEDTPPTNHLQLLRICLLASFLAGWMAVSSSVLFKSKRHEIPI